MTLLNSSSNIVTKNVKTLSLHDISALFSPVVNNYFSLINFFQKSIAITAYICSHTYLISLSLFQIFYAISCSIVIYSFPIIQLVLATCTNHFNKFPTKSSPMRRQANFFQEYTAIRRLRKKVAFELITFMLGAGNGIFLLIFWPGWLLIACLVCMIKLTCG